MEPFVSDDEMRRIIDEFVASEYPEGALEMYADYDEYLSDEQVAEILKSDDPMSAFYDILDDAYIDSRSYYINELEQQFDEWCEDKGYDLTASDVSDAGYYLDEYIGIEPDYDHFLDHEYNCRLIVDNGDGNYDFTHNPNQDNDFEIEDGAGIIWLGQQLGYSVEQMQNALNKLTRDEDYDGSPIDDVTEPDKFLDSLIHEAANAFGIVALTFLCRVSLADMIKFKENKSSITIDCNGMNCGFFDFWNGGGSVFELDCGKSITVPYDKVYEFTVDVSRPGRYSVDEVYGLWGGAYADATVN